MKKYALDEIIFFCLCFFAAAVVFSVTAVEAALLIALALLLTKNYKAGTLPSIKPALTGHPFFRPWMLYLGVCLLTSLTAYYPVKALGQLNSDFLKYVCLSTLLLAVKKEHLPALSRFYIAAAALSAAIGLGQVAHLFPSIYGDVSVRANATMNAVRYGEVMVIAVTLVLSKILLPRPEDSRKERFFYAAAAAAAFFAIILSQTRGAYLGLAVSMSCLFIFGKGFRLKVLGIAGLVLAAGMAAALANPEIGERLVTVARKPDAQATEQTAVNTRKELWKIGYKMFRTRPVFGIGPDNVKPLFTIFHPELIEGKKWGSLHNLYIHQAAERGLIGLGALLFLFGSMFLFALRRFSSVRSPYTLWALCVLPAHFSMNITEISFQHVHTSFAIFLALAFAAAAEEKKS